MSSQQGLLLQHAASPCASDSSVSSPRRCEALAAGEEEEGVQTMHAEKGKQEAADPDLPGAGVLDPALDLRRCLFPSATSEIEEAPPSPSPSPLPPSSGLGVNQATLRGGLGAGAGAGVLHPALAPRRHLFPSATSEIEEAPPSPPRVLAQNAAGGLGVSLLTDELRRTEATLAVLKGRLQELRGEGVSGSGRRCPPEIEPRRRDAGGAAAMEHELGAIHESLDSWQDRMLALRLQEDEVQAMKESLKAQRKNSKIGGICNWTLIVSALAFTTGLMQVVQFIQIWTLLPVHHYLTHFFGAIAVLWILGSIAFCRRILGTSRTTEGFSRHVARLLRVCFLLLVLYALYLISQLVVGTSAGLLGKRP